MKHRHNTVWLTAVLLLVQMATSGIWYAHALSAAGDQIERRLLQSVSGKTQFTEQCINYKAVIASSICLFRNTHIPDCHKPSLARANGPSSVFGNA